MQFPLAVSSFIPKLKICRKREKLRNEKLWYLSISQNLLQSKAKQKISFTFTLMFIIWPLNDMTIKCKIFHTLKKIDGIQFLNLLASFHSQLFPLLSITFSMFYYGHKGSFQFTRSTYLFHFISQSCHLQFKHPWGLSSCWKQSKYESFCIAETNKFKLISKIIQSKVS